MTCKYCGGDGPFYASRKHKCKDCVCRDVKSNRPANIDAVRAYDRERATLPHRIASATRVTREWRRRHPDRARAHVKAGSARMQPPALCELCDQPRRLEKHHHDYTKPLDVIWLCKPCHCMADDIRRYQETSDWSEYDAV